MVLALRTVGRSPKHKTDCFIENCVETAERLCYQLDGNLKENDNRPMADGTWEIVANKWKVQVNKYRGADKDLSARRYTYSGAGKSLTRPGRKQTTATEDFEFHICYL